MPSRYSYEDFSSQFRRYLKAATFGAPAIVVAIAAFGARSLDTRDVLLAIILTVLSAIAERYPLHLTHKTNVNVATAAYIAMILTLPSTLPGALALIAASAAQMLRWRAESNLTFPEAGFNAAQAGIYVGVGALTYGALAERALGPDVGPFGSIGALILAATAMHLTNTALVAIAGGLEMGISPLRVWWHSIALDLTPHVTLTVLGTVAALLAYDRPLLLPFLALPGLLVQRAVGQMVRLRVDTHEALASLVEVVELRDPYTAGHSRRVAQTSRALAIRLGLSEQEADVIEAAARVHDIGKVAINPLVLTKRGPLRPSEWAQIRQHPIHGANVVERFAAYQHGARLVRHHHERWDGRGYPDGLVGEEIPQGARILAVADAFDAMTSDRPYRAALDVEAALRRLEADGGSQWEQRVVEALVGLVRDDPGAVRIGHGPGRSDTVATVGRRARPEPDGGLQPAAEPGHLDPRLAARPPKPRVVAGHRTRRPRVRRHSGTPATEPVAVGGPV